MAETIREYAEQGFNAHIGCACGRIKVVSAATLLEQLERSGHKDDVESVKAVLRCNNCGQRPVDIRRRRGW